MSTIVTRDISIRQGSQYYEAMQRIEQRYLFEAQVAGTSAASAPTWPTALDATVTDGSTIIWLNKGKWDAALHPNVDVWLASFGYARRAKIVTPIAPVDLTGYTGAFQIREAITDVATVYTSTVTFGTRANGEFNMVIPTADTDDFDFVDAVYDIELSTAGGEVDFVVRGRAFLTKEVTR